MEELLGREGACVCVWVCVGMCVCIYSYVRMCVYVYVRSVRMCVRMYVRSCACVLVFLGGCVWMYMFCTDVVRKQQDLQWVDGGKGIFSVNLRLVSTIFTQV